MELEIEKLEKEVEILIEKIGKRYGWEDPRTICICTLYEDDTVDLKYILKVAQAMY